MRTSRENGHAGGSVQTNVAFSSVPRIGSAVPLALTITHRSCPVAVKASPASSRMAMRLSAEGTASDDSGKRTRSSCMRPNPCTLLGGGARGEP